MRKNILTFILFTLIINSFTLGQTIKIYGKLLNVEDNSIINNGILYLNDGNQVTSTNVKGEYSFNTTPGKIKIKSQVMGYKELTIELETYSDTLINIYIQLFPYELSEVTILGDSIKNIELTSRGSYVLTPATLRETPKLFSEPDLMKMLQTLPGVIAGKDGSSDIFVRGGGAGQNIILANGCYFFLPCHLLGVISPYDFDFLESAEIYKDYFPAELGGGASSVINLDFKKPKSDSLRAQLRIGFLSSGITIELPLKKSSWSFSAGLKRSNYSIYSPLLKEMINSDVGDFLPPDNYSFYDGFMQMSHNSKKWGNFNYLYFRNSDNGSNENTTKSTKADTIFINSEKISTGWNNMVHAIQWDLPSKNKLHSKINLNYNRLSMSRELFNQSEKSLNGTILEKDYSSLTFAPEINSFGFIAVLNKTMQKSTWSAGISNKLRYFSPNISSTNGHNYFEYNNNFSVNTSMVEPAVFVSATVLLSEKVKFDAGFRLSSGLTSDVVFFIPEPRLRVSFYPQRVISPHINYVRLSQFDHSVEGSSVGLRTMLMLPASKDFGPEISDVFSAGFTGHINTNYQWTLDGYYKKTSGMLDYKPGASFIFDTSFVDILDKIKGISYGLETGIIKRMGKLTGSLSYTFSRSKREWSAPEGLIWIPSNADRPHNFNIVFRYYFKKRTSFGLNWVYQSGAPATIYMHNTSYGEWFETKYNIRYFAYHRLDISFRQILYNRRFSIFLDADIYNVYNRKNTFYFKETYDLSNNTYYFKNISLFPIMPSLTLTFKYQ